MVKDNYTESEDSRLYHNPAEDKVFEMIVPRPSYTLESPDERPGKTFISKLAKLTLFGVGATVLYKFSKPFPSIFAPLVESLVKNPKFIHRSERSLIEGSFGLVAELKRAMTSGLDYRNEAQFKATIRSNLLRYARDVETDLPLLTVGDLLNAQREIVSEGDRQFVKATLQGGKNHFLVEFEDFKIIENAFKRGYVLKETALSPTVFVQNGNVVDMRHFYVGGWLARNAEKLSRMTRIPILGFSPLDLLMRDFWQDKPFFVGRELSRAGIGYERSFYIGGKLYAEIGGRIRLIEEGVNLGFTSTNIGYAHAVRQGFVNEMLYGPRQLHKHKKYRGMPYELFLEKIWPELSKDSDRLIKEADEVWMATRAPGAVAEKILSIMPDALKREVHPKYARHGSFWSSISEAFENLYSGTKQRVVISEEFYEQYPWNRVIEKIESAAGFDTKHIRWIDKDKAEEVLKDPSKLKEALRREKRPTGQVASDIFGQVITKTPHGVEYSVPKYYIYNPEETPPTDVALYYVAERINRLYEGMTGFGIRPARTWYGQFMRQLTHVAIPTMVAWYGLNLANDIVAGITGDTISPKKALAYTMGTALLTKQAALNVTGASIIAQHMEEVMPGSTDSFLADIAMTVGGGFIGAKIGSKFGRTKFGALLGLAVGALFSLGDPAQPVGELWDELTGKKMVPVRKNRGWMFGRQSFKGDEVKFFKPHWVRMMLDDIATKARYGSKWNYWMYGSLPGQMLQVAMRPIGLGNPYWLEEKGPWKYSYPISNPIFQDIPFIGPLIEWGVGSLVKPYRYYVPKGLGWARPYKYPDSGLTPHEMQSIGVEPIIERTSVPLHPFSLIAQIGNVIHNMEQYTGLIGWGIGATFGQFNKGEFLESFHNLYGISNRYYTNVYGGVLGLSEYPRRFMPRQLGKLGWYNPLPAPYIRTQDFPGTLAAAEEDRPYPIDFYYGGPTKIPFGEIRLPGPGLKAVLGIDASQELDAIDKYLMLSYLTPGSRAMKDARRVVKSWIKAGVVDYDTARKLGWAQWSISERLRRMHFDPLSYSSMISGKDSFYLDYLARLFSPPTIGTKRIKDPAALDIVRSYNEAAVRERWQSFSIPGADFLASFIWKNITHVDLPIPFIGTLLTRKLIHNRTALEEYEYTRLYSNSFASWDTPIQTVAVDTVYNMLDLFGLNIKPPRVEKESDIILYTDALKYLKYRELEHRAMLYNQPKIAEKLRQAMRQTIVGADYTTPFTLMKSAYRSMPGPDKPFLKSFMFAPYSDREVIYNEVAPHMKRLLEKAWNVGRYKDYNNIVKIADREALEIVAANMRKYNIPPAMFWHPGFDMYRERLRLARREALDIHRFGLWEQQEWRYDNGVVGAW